MQNGLYSIHIKMLDGVKGRATGIIVIHDGVILGGDPYFYYTGTYSFREGTCSSREGTWKGELVTRQHTPLRGARPVFGGMEVGVGFSGTYNDGDAEVFGTSLVGTRSIGFRATLRKQTDS